MAVISSRADIKTALDAKNFTLFVISGAADSAVAQAVHAKAEAVCESWQRVLWIQDLSLLKENQKEEWLGMGGRYAVVARRTREPMKWGYTSEFMLSNGRVAGSRIVTAISFGDV